MRLSQIAHRSCVADEIDEICVLPFALGCSVLPLNFYLLPFAFAQPGGSPWIIATASVGEPGSLTMASLASAGLASAQWTMRSRRAPSRSLALPPADSGPGVFPLSFFLFPSSFCLAISGRPASPLLTQPHQRPALHQFCEFIFS